MDGFYTGSSCIGTLYLCIIKMQSNERAVRYVICVNYSERQAPKILDTLNDFCEGFGGSPMSASAYALGYSKQFVTLLV